MEGRLPVCEGCNKATQMSCSVCDKQLTEYFRVGREIFCEEHYAPTRCSVCQKGLTQYYSHEGRILCVSCLCLRLFLFLVKFTFEQEADYKKLTDKNCVVCQVSLDTYYELDKKVFCELHYHAERLKSAPRCSVCKIAVTSYTKMDGLIYCEKDKPRCVKCKCELSRLTWTKIFKKCFTFFFFFFSQLCATRRRAFLSSVCKENPAPTWKVSGVAQNVEILFQVRAREKSQRQVLRWMWK